MAGLYLDPPKDAAVSSFPDTDLKQAKPIIAARIIAAFVFLLISSSIDASDSAAVPAIAKPATLEVWPAGTRLLIPNRVMEDYQKESDLWTHPSVYLFANYFLTGPSLQEKRKETVYIPLAKEQAGKAEQREVLMDIMNIRKTPDNHDAFVTSFDIHIISINSNGEDLYIGEKVEY